MPRSFTISRIGISCLSAAIAAVAAWIASCGVAGASTHDDILNVKAGTIYWCAWQTPAHVCFVCDSGTAMTGCGGHYAAQCWPNAGSPGHCGKCVPNSFNCPSVGAVWDGPGCSGNVVSSGSACSYSYDGVDIFDETDCGCSP